jgi:hypothetical protein
MDWLAKAMGLPEFFLSTGNGGGIIQGKFKQKILEYLIVKVYLT